jgi:oxygen-independent coproporphyrinogen III oxidase
MKEVQNSFNIYKKRKCQRDCDRLCFFCGCNTFITKNKKRVQKYLDYLKEEIRILSTYIHPNKKIKHIHWGGGTPTHLSPNQISELKSHIEQHFEISAIAEQSCEIDPRKLTREHLEVLQTSGFNRISLGVQDFNPIVQKAINRIQSEELTLKVIHWIKELQFDSFNVDLIYGLPFQTKKEFAKTIKKTIEISPDRIALFNFAYVPWLKPHMKLIKEQDLPTPQEKLDILEMSIETLIHHGYLFIGMDHFAKPEDELSKALKNKKLYRNFQGYSTNSDIDIYACGITGISQIGNIYAQNHKIERTYFEAIDNGILPLCKGYQLNKDDIIRRTVIMKIMCDFELDFSVIDSEFHIDSQKYFTVEIKRIQPLILDGLLINSNNKLIITEKGRLLVRNIAMCFDKFITQDSDVYSKTI